MPAYEIRVRRSPWPPPSAGWRIMGFLASAVIVTAMGIISLSIGAIAFLVLRFGIESSAIFALAGFAVLIVLQFTTWRREDRKATTRTFDDLSRSNERLSRDVAMLANRIAVIETAGAVTAAQDVAALRSDLHAAQKQIGELAGMLSDQQQLLETLSAPAAADMADEPMMMAPPPAMEAAVMPQRRGRFAAMGHDEFLAMVVDAMEGGRIDLLLQPVVTLPQRKVKWYEIVYHLKNEHGEVILADDFLPAVAEAGMAGRLDSRVLFRVVHLLRRLQARNREAGVIVNFAPATFSDGDRFREIVDFLAANSALSGAIVIEMSQAAYADFGALEFESLSAIRKLGFRFSLDHVRNLRLNTRDLADRGFRLLKVPAELLLGRTDALPSDIHPADLSGLLSRYGIDLIADKIETEATVLDLLDLDLRFGQGNLFSPPRPVRADVLSEGPLVAQRAAS
ncbi:EAL domain-containing protein [Candidatus Raskinella chloraquaticus]|jgi:cyclic-di-GMP phosphodiesterase, flagellum assembly factor TipF|uniref:EAL domain-containing protein n=2 Tax=Candidatus Raskinella chloraquaticus TaxID=1951219 RepID=A0A1W9HWF6_9HYPH|nr:MAG: hypothetical protein A4S15_09855 [Proteobacteria bacterium SG_bin8]